MNVYNTPLPSPQFFFNASPVSQVYREHWPSRGILFLQPESSLFAFLRQLSEQTWLGPLRSQPPLFSFRSFSGQR